MRIERNRSLRELNTLRLDSRAERYVRVESVEELREALALARARTWPVEVLGAGSNSVLCERVPGLVIHVAIPGRERLDEDARWRRVKVGAGEDWPNLVDACVERGWHGLENLALIPGLAGAAPVQNIGAYGAELSRCLVGLHAVARDSGEPLWMSAADCGLGYRDSVFKRELAGRVVICALELRLEKRFAPCLDHPALRSALGDQAPSARAVRDAVVRLRRARLPDPAAAPNAGSFFRNPVVSEAHYQSLRRRWPALPGRRLAGGVQLPAAWLLSQSGWRGRRCGRVAMSRRHALVLVNLGGASAAEALAFSAAVQRSVRRRFGVSLAREPVAVGASAPDA